MKKQEFSSFGIGIEIPVPETVEEFNNNAKNPNACLNEAINNVIYRSSLVDFRSTMLEAVEKITGIERATEPVLDDKGNPKTKTVTVIETDANGNRVERKMEEEVLRYKDSESKYFNKVCATLGHENDAFQPLAQLVVDGCMSVAEDGSRTIIPEQRAKLVNFIQGIDRVDADDELVDEICGIIGTGVVFDASATPRQPSAPKKIAKTYLDTADKLIADGIGAAVAAKLSEMFGIKFTADRESLGKAIQMHEAEKRAAAQRQMAANYAKLVS